MFLNGDLQSPLSVLLYDFVSSHAEGFIHKIIHETGVCTETAADIGEGKSVMGVPVGLGKEGGDGFKICHAGKVGNKCKKKQGFSAYPPQNMSIFSFFYCFFSFLVSFSCYSSDFLVYNHFVLPILLSLTKPDCDMDNSSIKNNIRKIRKARKLTQEEMALRLGISLTAYRDFEKGSTSILNGNLHKIASLLDTPAEEIVLGYRPSQIEGSNLQQVQAEYSGRIDTLERRIRDLEKLVESHEEVISSKNEIIAMLKKRLDEER